MNNLLNSCYQLQDVIVQERGVGIDYSRTHDLTKRVKCIKDCIVDMEMVALDPDDDLENAFVGKRLQFQKPIVQQWMDGTAAVPE
ncbi:hypothetical protein VNI00_016056 [Paramarasmius palmivorus]|uniref:Uncharacterized protein n=1 Tax=Paramarasmius palmivorus TaxID=297713 RepID=A0AAW0BGS8_9AGAR